MAHAASPDATWRTEPVTTVTAGGGPHQPNLPVERDEVDQALRSWRFWLVVLAVGIGAGVGAGVLMVVLHAVQHLAYDYRNGDFQHGVGAVPGWRRVLVLVGAGAVLGTAWVLLRRVGGPVRSLDEAVWERAGRLRFFDTAVNAVLQIVAVGAGATLGREGAPKELGAGLASSLCDRAGLSPTERRVLVACGAGAGMAAVYNVPLGGALFAVEVLLGTITLPLVVPALATAGIATGVSWLLLPDRPTYEVGRLPLSASVTLWAVPLGLFAGLCGTGLILLVGWAKARATRGTRTALSVTTAFAAVGALAVALPEVLGNGKDVTQLAFSGALSLPLVGAIVVARTFSTGACLRAGAVGGLFTPTLAIGALLGTLAGRAWEVFWPAGPVPGLALIGAAALLSGAMQSPLASIVLVVELTHSGLALLVPIALAATGATVISRVLVPASLYTAASWWRDGHAVDIRPTPRLEPARTARPDPSPKADD